MIVSKGVKFWKEISIKILPCHDKLGLYIYLCACKSMKQHDIM